MVDWLYSHVEGFVDRRDARRYACNLLKAGFIHHTVNKLTFSEQCYYVFGNTVSKGLNWAQLFILFWFIELPMWVGEYLREFMCWHVNTE